MLIIDEMIDAMETFVYDLKNDWNNVKSSASTARSKVQSVYQSVTGMAQSVIPYDLHTFLDPMIILLRDALDKFINSDYNVIDTNSHAYAYLSWDFDADCSGLICWGSSKIDIDYTVKNLGGNQVVVYSWDYEFSESSDNNRKTVEYENWYWFIPGNTKSGSLQLDKSRWASSVTVYGLLKNVDASTTIDLRGENYNAAKHTNNVFPKTGYSKLTYSLGGREFRSADIDLDRKNDVYSRVFKIFINDNLWYETIISAGLELCFMLPAGTTKITFQINWGGYATEGWIMKLLLLY